MTQPRKELEDRIEAVLAGIRKAIGDGDVEEAKRRIRGIPILVSPGSRFAREIGDLYWELGFPAMAGRYWYLLEEKTEQMLSACQEFERSRGHNPWAIFTELGGPNLSPYAKATIDRLRKETQELQREFRYDRLRLPRWKDRIALVGCALVATVFMSVLWIGILGLVSMFRGTWGPP